VQALAGLTIAGEGAGPLDEARALFEKKDGLDFSLFWLCSDEVSLGELSRAAGTPGPKRPA